MCSISDGDTCDVTATATIVYDEGEDTAGASSARGVDSLSNVENFQKIATSTGVDAEQVNDHYRRKKSVLVAERGVETRHSQLPEVVGSSAF